MSEESINSNGHETLIKPMLPGKITTRMEPLGAEALRNGLNSLIASDDRFLAEEVPIKQLVFNRHRFRLTPPDATNVEELSQAIKKQGFLGVLIGRRSRRMVELAFGERRVQAAKLAGLKTIPVQIRSLDDSAMFELALEENFLSTSLSPLEESFTFNKMLTDGGYNPASIAARCARPPEYVVESLQLLQYPEIVEAVQSGKLEIETARALAKIEDSAMRLKLLRQALSLGGGERLPARFIVTSVGLDLPDHPASEAGPETELGEVPRLWGANGKARKQHRAKPAEMLDKHYVALENLVNHFISDLKQQELAGLGEDEEYRKKSRRLLKSLETTLNYSFKQLKS